jgi:N-dimethylarginine dimethylaminohydrolase
MKKILNIIFFMLAGALFGKDVDIPDHLFCQEEDSQLMVESGKRLWSYFQALKEERKKKFFIANEWDPLRVVIVGGANPEPNPKYPLPKGTEEEVAGLIKILEERGIKVYHYNEFPNAKAADVCTLFPRDPLVIIEDCVIECAMRPGRRQEGGIMRNELLLKVLEQGQKYIPMPAPQKPLNNTVYDDRDESDCVITGGSILIGDNQLYVGSTIETRPSRLLWGWKKASQGLQYVLPKNRLESMTKFLEKRRTYTYSSKPVIEWLEKLLPLLDKSYTIHEIQFKQSQKIFDLDQCLSLVRPGLGIICKDLLLSEVPKPLQSWDLIEITEEEVKTNGGNILILDESTVVIDERNERIVQELEKRGITVIKVPFAKVGTKLGGLRCWHQPLLRRK